MLANTRSQPLLSTRGGTLRRVALLAAGCLVAMALLTSNAFAGQLPVALGAASSYAALAGSTVTSTGPTTLNGDLGVWPGTSLTGFPPGKVTGMIHAGDPFAMAAQGDLTAAYNDAAGRQPPQALPADVGGRTLAPGVYKTGATPALGLTGTLTLDGQGDPNAVFVFQVGSALTTAVSSQVNLIGGAQAGNVFWQIGSSATLGTSSTFAGSILALTSISINSGVTLNGRALARNGAVTLINDTINVPTSTPTPTPTPSPSPSPPPPVGGGPSGFCVTSHAPIGSADRRPPDRPLLLSPRAGARVSPGLVRFSWRPAPRAARYTLMLDHHRMSTGCATRAAMRVSVGSHSYRVFAENRYGTRSSPPRAITADNPPTVERIRQGLGLDVLDRTVVAEAERIALRSAEGVAFRTLLKALGKFASKAGILGFLAAAGLDAEPTSCEEDLVYRRAKPAFRLTAGVLGRVSRADIGRHPRLRAQINDARSALNKAKQGNQGILRLQFSKECLGAKKVALATINKLYTTLTAADVHLKALADKSFEAKCMTAQKLLKEYERIFPKAAPGKRLSPKTIKELNKKRDNGTIKFDDLPAKLKKRFPGEFKGYSLKEIEELCKKK